MSEVLIPYSQFMPRGLVDGLSGAVLESRDLLQERNILGPIERYANGDRNHALEMIEKGRHEHLAGVLFHYAIVGSFGEIQGAASIDPSLPLYKPYLPIPAGISRRVPFLRTSYHHAMPNIHAWTRSGKEDLLTQAYQELVQKTHKFDKPWTIEPVTSPREIHEAIASAGLTAVATHRYDDGESGRKVPKRSVLYSTAW